MSVEWPALKPNWSSEVHRQSLY